MGGVAEGLQSLAANIRRLRLRRGWTQERLASVADIEARYVQTLESGRANPTVAIIITVAEALGVRPQELFRHARLGARPRGRPPKQRQ
jgi:transcriptional regulator with XRE-family HTH domain